jgi:hypothetical protein
MLRRSSRDPRLLADLIREGRDRRLLQTALGGGAAAVDSSGTALGSGDYIRNALVDAKGDLIAASGADTPIIVTVGADGYQLVARASQDAGMLWTAQYADILIVLDGSGAPVQIGAKMSITLDFDCVLISWNVFSDVAATARFDLWKTTYAAAPPTVANAMPNSNANKPQLAAATKATGGVAGWTTTAFTAGDVLKINLDTNDLGKLLSASLKVRKT